MVDSLPPMVPPYTVELDDSAPIVVAQAAQAFGMASCYLDGAPPDTMAVIRDAAGHLWAMKTNDAGEVIDVPF